MSRRSSVIGVLTTVFVLGVALGLAVAAFAQNGPPPLPKGLKFPRPSGRPAVQQEQVLSYWTTETGWTSELQLRNNSLQSLTVTPVLRLADGTETPLASVTIKPEEAQAIDLDQAIAAAGASQLIGTYGSVALRFVSPSSSSLYAAMVIRRPRHPTVFHVDAMGNSQAMEAGGSEGIWWLPTSATNGYFVMTNLGANAIPVSFSIYDASGRQNGQTLSLAAHQTLRFSIRALAQAAGFTATYGGINVAATSHAGSLDTLAFLYDDSAGFGAILKMFDYDPNAKLAERDYAHTGQWTLRAPMLALSTPDPALAFPSGTQLHPLLFIHNVTAKTINAALRFNWRAGNATGKASGPALQLSPYQTQEVDVAALQKAGTIPLNANWALVTLTTNSLPDEVVAIASSYSDNLRYGAQTPFNDQMTYRWEGGMWAYDAYHDSIITAGNGGTQPIQARFTLFYNQGTKRYDMVQTLQPDGQMWVDVGQLIRSQTPDVNGNTLPSTLTRGSYEIADLSHHGAGTLFEGKVIYDKMYGSAAYGCALCCGYATINCSLDSNPLGIPYEGTSPQGVQAEDMCEGGQYDDVSDAFYGSWTTGNSSVATADYYGTHTGTGIGSTNSNTHGELNSNDVPQRCPLHGYNPSGGDNTAPKITGANTLWYFGGQNPNGTAYPISITLSENGVAGTWNVVSGSDRITLSPTTGTSTTLTPTGNHFSGAVGDTCLTVTVNEQTSNQFCITVRTPWKLVFYSTATIADSVHGYKTTITYNLDDNLGTVISADIFWNEALGTNQSENGSNWGSCCGPIQPGPGDWSVSRYLGTSSVQPTDAHLQRPPVGHNGIFACASNNLCRQSNGTAGASAVR